MDYVVHINNGSEEARPIVLRLLPGEETIFNLKVVNHGEPSNISLEASDPVFKAVRLKKPDHYVVLEETIPVLARMPANKKRLDGELLLTSSAGSSSVPISLLREPEDPGDDLEDPGVQVGEDLKDYLDEEAREEVDEEADEGSEDTEASEAAEDVEDTEDFVEVETERETGPEEEKEARRIEFSRHRDLQSYKSASRPRNVEENIERHIEGQRSPQDRQGNYQGYRNSSGYEVGEYASESEFVPEVAETEESYESSKGSFFDVFGGKGALQIIPAAILLALIAVLVLTFFTESIPEFPGALASSILIVTLIIYGAATLLKA